MTTTQQPATAGLKLHRPWTFTQKFVFRFFFCFILLWTLPFPLSNIPYFDKLESIAPWFTKAYWSVMEIFWESWNPVAEWVGANIFHLKGPVFNGPSGSGDRTLIYLIIFSKISTTLIAASTWSILDWRRKSYNTLYYWTRVLTRYFLAYTMFSYGFSKVFHLQMSFPRLGQLTMLFGDKSPMGLAWSFMGYSKAFSFYTGIGEIAGGLLLLWRRTTALGALVVMIVMSTVAMMNYSFDIPVKFHSTLYFVLACILLLPDCKRIMNVLVWNKPAEPAVYPSMIQRSWLKKIVLVLKYAFIIGVLASNIERGLEGQKMYGDKRTKPPLYGIYNTEYIIRNNDTIPLLQNDSTLWKQIVIDFPQYASIKSMNDTMRFYNFKVDTNTSTAMVFPRYDTLSKMLLHYKYTAPYLDLQGVHKGDTLNMRLKRYNENNFLLVRQRFRWICEMPLNR